MSKNSDIHFIFNKKRIDRDYKICEIRLARMRACFDLICEANISAKENAMPTQLVASIKAGVKIR